MLDNSSRPLQAEGPANVNVTADTIGVRVRYDNWGPNQPSVLQAAHWYAERGIAVFPLGPAKRPLARCAACRPVGACPGRNECRCGVDTCHGFYAATLDRAVINRWWGRHPDWQLGLRTGQVSDLVALDVDLDKGGLDSLTRCSNPGWPFGARRRSSAAAACRSICCTGTRAARYRTRPVGSATVWTYAVTADTWWERRRGTPTPRHRSPLRAPGGVDAVARVAAAVSP